MKLNITAFSERGRNLAKKVMGLALVNPWEPQDSKFDNVMHFLQPCLRQSEEGLPEWTKKAFVTGAPILFIGATGIAVRAIAPFVKSKVCDSPVLVMDEGANFVIPILSGHLGGANDLARQLADAVGAVPVITTATDVNQVFSVDDYARRNGLFVLNPKGIATVATKMLQGATFQKLMESGEIVIEAPDIRKQDKTLDDKTLDERIPLRLRPRLYVVGIGCKRGKTFAEIQEAFTVALQKASEMERIELADIAAVASIDIKKDEQGICDMADYLRVPFFAFSKEALYEAEGTFLASDFVESKVGVDNVCERAAVLASEGGPIVLHKMAKDGVTIAIAKKEME